MTTQGIGTDVCHAVCNRHVSYPREQKGKQGHFMGWAETMWDTLQ